MSLFKCKMCGGTLEIGNNETVAICEYCGTPQTIPRLDDEKRANLYDRANHFRRNNEFDKAAAIYEQILNEDGTDAEAYWSLVLCRYGIEYVEDPASRRRIPTVNRAQFTSIFDDDNYKSALQYADGYQSAIYEDEAKAINEIQKGILAISQREEPFDVFVCYKETDKNGRRTPDSVLANDLYHQLTQEGFKVFFSRITLEDKLGSAYEPYIFAALNSAKVMVVLGTRPEYFNAVWVKNEWSRYLALIKQGKKKMLIPAYKDMDPYDLPEEFSHLQAQDMSKLGFMQDLIRGIKKLLHSDGDNNVTVKETVTVNTGANVAPLLERAFLFLEDGYWEEADIYCEKVLDQEPKNAEAYLGKLMAELHVKKRENLKKRTEPFNDNNNYQKAIRFGSLELADELKGYIDSINERNERDRKEGIYAKAVSKMIFDEKSVLESAVQLFESISDWRDSREKIEECKSKISEMERREEAVRLERERKAEIERKKAEKRAKRNKKIAIITIIAVIAIIASFLVIDNVIIPNVKYNAAVALMDEGKYEEAIAAFEAMNGYKDSADQITKCNTAINTAIMEGKYNTAIELMNVGNIDKAYNIFRELGDYEDSKERVGDIRITKLKDQLNNGSIGSYVTFGAYEQDNNTENGKEDILWLVLEVKDGKALVVSKYALDCQPYNSSHTNVTWETCSLREWLNGIFFDSAFSAKERDMIPTVTVSADENPQYSTDPGNATQDKVFLLSVTEADQYFSSYKARQCEPTAYAIANGAYKNNSNGNCWWLLRSSGNSRFVAYVGSYGDINEDGDSVDYHHNAVRPAMWIDLET